MRLMSFNTQHCQSFITQKTDYELMASVIKALNPDVVALQEMRGYTEGAADDYEEQVEILAKKCEFPYFFFGEAIRVCGKNPYGNGILSKEPIKTVETVLIPEPSLKKYNGYYEARCIIKATLSNGLTVLATHFGLNPDEQENAVRAVVENLTCEKCAVLGDLNVTPKNPLLNPIRERMLDTASAFKGPLLSFPSDEPYEKIDYIFVTRDIQVLSADIPSVIASDHRPYICEINF